MELFEKYGADMNDFLKELILEAGKICLDARAGSGDIGLAKKSEKDLVTEVDVAVERFLVERIGEKYPEHAFLCEESGSSEGNEYRWIIDPIDGTTSFVHDQPFYSISIALEKAGKLELAAVYAPALNELFMAQRGQGATLNGEKICVSGRDKIGDCVLGTGFACMRSGVDQNNLPIFTKLMPLIRGVRRYGSAAMDLCYVACGKLDGFWELNLNAYDVAAGILILEEAGGKYTDFGGGLENKYVQNLATNSKIHSQLEELLAEFSDYGCQEQF